MSAAPDRPFIAPIPTREWDPSMFEALMLMKPPEDSEYGERRRERGSGGTGLFNVLANHPDLTAAFFAFNRHLLYTSTLAARDRELVVLRVAFLRNCAYEWAQHVPVANGLGIEPDDVERIAVGPGADGWSDVDRALLTAVDELHTDGTLSSPTWTQLAATLDTKQLMDLVFTVGAYDTFALALNSFGLELDDDLAAYPLPTPPGS